MNEQTRRQIDETKPACPPASWVRPEVVRLEAGAAEFGDFDNPDGSVAS